MDVYGTELQAYGTELQAHGAELQQFPNDHLTSAIFVQSPNDHLRSGYLSFAQQFVSKNYVILTPYRQRIKGRRRPLPMSEGYLIFFHAPLLLGSLGNTLKQESTKSPWTRRF
jgi:hypothetical protein